MAETWQDRVRQRTHAAVVREDNVRDLSYELKQALLPQLKDAIVSDLEVTCSASSHEFIEELLASGRLKELIKECLREVLQEAIK